MTAATTDTTTAALDQLEHGLRSLLDSDTFRAYLAMLARFHRYSWANSLMILAQRPDATLVNAYTRWQTLGRQVTKGQKGIAIWVPRTRKDDAGAEQLVGFRLGYVFDVAQTAGDPLPAPPAPVELTATDGAAAVFAQLSNQVLAQGIQLVREPTRPALGYWDARRRVIGVDVDLTGWQATKTLCHEYAHALADHRAGVPKDDAETVAEAAAFVVLAWLGIDTSAYSVPYIGAWMRDMDTFKTNLAAIRATSAAIIDRLAAGLDDAGDDDLAFVA